MKTLITLSNKKTKIPKEFQKDDNRYSELLVKYFLDLYTTKGDKIFDPFAGLGTSLIVSEKMRRIPFGIELDRRRCEFIKSKLIHKENVICGNSLQLNKNNFPKFDFSMTSPPYNPIFEENYLSGKGGYSGFIKDIGKIYSQLKKYMRKNSYIVIEVSNLKGDEVTTLAWDIGKEVSRIFHFEGEVIVNWKKKEVFQNHGYDHSYCLIFKNI
ncbi:MAG: DNA methyltransferase [Patescibacteria group bacterium]